MPPQLNAFAQRLRADAEILGFRTDCILLQIGASTIGHQVGRLLFGGQSGVDIEHFLAVVDTSGVLDDDESPAAPMWIAESRVADAGLQALADSYHEAHPNESREEGDRAALDLARLIVNYARLPFEENRSR